MSDEWTVERIQELSGNNKPFRSLPERLREQGQSNLAAENEQLRAQLAGSEEALAKAKRESRELREEMEVARKVAEAAVAADIAGSARLKVGALLSGGLADLEAIRLLFEAQLEAMTGLGVAIREYRALADPPPLETRLASALDQFGEKESKADALIKEALMEEVMSGGRDGEC